MICTEIEKNEGKRIGTTAALLYIKNGKAVCYNIRDSRVYLFCFFGDGMNLNNYENYYKKYEPIWGAWYVKNLIGEGGFGKVYEIEREDFGVTYKAALKAITIPQSQSEIKSVMADGMDEASVTAYFKQFVEEIVSEFQLMFKMKGTNNIVSYEDHAVIKHSEGIGWDILLRMELLTSLIDHIRKARLARKDIIQLGIDMCLALELCQKHNIIHRDIKPENIFISDNGNYKLGDFGIARTVEKTTIGLSKKGTYTYMAPEIYRGEAYGPSVDIYSLGIVMYRLLNDNRAPFLPAYPAPITHNDRETANMKRISGMAIPRPKSADGGLVEIVLKACAYSSKDRYSSPIQMREELEAVLNDGSESKIIYPNVDEIPIKYIMPDIPESETANPFALGYNYAETNIAASEINNFNVTDSLYTCLTESESAVSPKRGKSVWKNWKLYAVAAAASCLVILAVSFWFFTKPSNDELRYAGNAKPQEQQPTIYERSQLSSASPAPKSTPRQTLEQTLEQTLNPAPQPTPRTTQEIAADVGSFDTISAGHSHTLVIKNDGSLWAWGLHNYRDVGDETSFSSFFPERIMDEVKMVSAGALHTIAVKTDGSLWVWGSNSDGQLGDGTKTDRSYPVKIMDEVKTASAGYGFTMAVKTDGSLWAWGNNEFGQIGDGTTTNRYSPIEITDSIATVSAGGYHTMAIKTDGSLWAWGANGFGQLGDVTTTDRLSPVKVMDSVATVSAGSGFTMAVKTDGSLWSWGLNSGGQLGYETAILRSSPIEIMDSVAMVSAGAWHTIAVKTDGSLWTWGNNEYGQIGDGTTTDRPTPVKIMDEVKTASAGAWHSMAVKTDGSIWTWGTNFIGQLGDGTTDNRKTPVKIMDDA